MIDKSKQQITGMFNSIAHRYDFLNHFLSMGMDFYWRKIAVSKLKGNKVGKVLDVAAGTADLSVTIAKAYPDAKIWGVDISEEMLNIGRQKIKKRKLENSIFLQYGDSLDLQFEQEYFDVVSVAFGVRNFQNLEGGLAEMKRVLKKDGKLIILEFSTPKVFPIKQTYHFYSKIVMPFIGNLISKNNKAYKYLPQSVREFPYGNDFLKIVEKLGFKHTKYSSLTFGIVNIYEAKK